MLLQSLEHVAYRVAGLAGVVYAAEKSRIMQSIISSSDRDMPLAAKTALVLAGSEYLSDMVFSQWFGTTLPSFTSTLQEFGYSFVTNTIVLYAMDKMDLDQMIVRPGSNDEMRALQMAVLFVVVQEITHKLLSMIY